MPYVIRTAAFLSPHDVLRPVDSALKHTHAGRFSEHGEVYLARGTHHNHAMVLPCLASFYQGAAQDFLAHLEDEFRLVDPEWIFFYVRNEVEAERLGDILEEWNANWNAMHQSSRMVIPRDIAELQNDLNTFLKSGVVGDFRI